jgi:hypothetical protein
VGSGRSPYREASWRNVAVGAGSSARVSATRSGPRLFLPQFIDPQAGSVAFQYLVLGSCFIAFEIAVDGTVGILAGRLNRVLTGSRGRRNLNLTAGSVYLGLSAKIALER